MNNNPSEFIYIYRRGKGERAVRLYREQDWRTGLSFSVTPFERGIKFNVSSLREAGYIVRFDGGELVYSLFDHTPVMVESGNQGSIEQRRFGENHVTVYLPDQTQWNAWYQAETALQDPTDSVSEQTLKLFELREMGST